MLSDYMDTIEEKADTIEKAVADGDLETYTIEVHSLKSVSKSIGALELSELARELEANGRNSEWGPIIARTPAMLAMYRGLYQVIRPYRTRSEAEDGGQEPVDEQAVRELLGQLIESADTFDSILGEETVAALSKYDFADSWSEEMREVAEAVNRFDYAACRELAQQWLEKLDAKNAEEV